MIDLHIHSIYSDGTDSLKDILIKSEKMNLKVISITDHDLFSAYDELDNSDIERYFSGKIIKGIEITTSYKGRKIELLAYNFKDTKKLEKYLLDNQKEYDFNGELKKYRTFFVNEMDKLGLKYNKEILSQMETDRKFETILYDSIIENNDINYIKEKLGEDFRENGHIFYKRRVQNIESKFYLKYTNKNFEIKEVIDICHELGAKVFLAHPNSYGISNLLSFLDDLYDNNEIDGIECYHSMTSYDESIKLFDFANKHNLYISGGSDYHGDKKNINLGFIYRNKETVPIDIINTWDFLKKE